MLRRVMLAPGWSPRRTKRGTLRTPLSAAAAIVPGIVGIRVPGGLLLLFVAVVGLAGAHKASSTWPRRILYSVPFVTMTLGMVLGPSMFESVGVMPVAEFVIFSMIGAVPGLVLYGLVRFVVNRVSPPDHVD
jgi:hypothetical protein